jgi:hypothetical protein
MSKGNVVGTAVGLYLIRDKEDWPQAQGEGVRPRRPQTYERTFANSHARDYSWPCIIALVREWIDAEEAPPPRRRAGGGVRHRTGRALLPPAPWHDHQ